MKHYLTPGPSQLYPTVPAHLQEALAQDIPSISHRSPAFMDFYAALVRDLKALFQAPEDYHVFVFASATEIWERLAQNTIEKASFHLVNGDFSARFRDTVRAYHKEAYTHEVAFGQGFDPHTLSIPSDAELIAAIANETSSGVWTSAETIHTLAAAHADKLVVVDAVSCAPLHPVALSKIDGLYFSVQKCFGLPAGLAVLLASPRLLAKSRQLEAQGHATGSYHSFSSLQQYALKHQTPETPNVLGIYLLHRVVADLLRDQDEVRASSQARASQLYALLDQHPRLSAFVQTPAHRSQTVIVVDSGPLTSGLQATLAQAGILVGEGYGKLKSTQLRIANFPAISPAAWAQCMAILSQA